MEGRAAVRDFEQLRLTEVTAARPPRLRTTSVDGSRSLSASRKSCGTVSQDFEQLRLKEVKVTQVLRLLATAFAEVRYLLRWSNPARERVTGTPFFKEFRRVHSYNFVFQIRSLLAAFLFCLTVLPPFSTPDVRCSELP